MLLATHSAVGGEEQEAGAGDSQWDAESPPTLPPHSAKCTRDVLLLLHGALPWPPSCVARFPLVLPVPITCHAAMLLPSVNQTLLPSPSSTFWDSSNFFPRRG